MNPAHHITFLLSRKLFAEETNYSDTSCSVWSQVSSNSKSSLSLPKCLLNFYILKRAAYHTWGWCDSLAHMSSLAQDLHVVHKHQLVMSSLWQSWAPNISGLTPASGPEPCSCPAGISAEAEATWELWDGAGGMKSTAHLAWRQWHRAGAGTAGPWLHVFAVPSFLSSNNSFWLKSTYHRMQLSSAMGNLCEFPSPPQFTIWAFMKGLCLLTVKPETPLMHRGIKSLWKQPITFHVMKCKENFYAWASQSFY